MKTEEKIKRVEANHQQHFECLPRALGFDVRRMEGLSIIRCGLGSSMFNIVYGAPPYASDVRAVIHVVKNHFQGQPFAWWIPIQCGERDQQQAFLDEGGQTATTENAMIRDLSNLPFHTKLTNLNIQLVVNPKTLQDFIHVLGVYDLSARTFYEKMRPEHFMLEEKLFVGYEQNQPVTVAILYVKGDAAGIFSLITSGHAQSRGYGTAMMHYLLNEAKRYNCRYATLSASSEGGYRIYERLGFERMGTFECWEF